MSFKHNIQRTSHRIKLSILTLALSISPFISAHEHKEGKLGFETTKLNTGLYMISGVGGFTGGNIALIIGDDGAVMIDNGLSTVTDTLKKEIAKTTKKPIDYLINTHLHGDHIGNNANFSNDGAKIISHKNLRASLVKKDDPKANLPVLTFSDQMTLYINGDSARITHIKNAHTDGDAIIHFEKSNVIHTGDIMFNGRFPFIDGNNGGTLAGVIAGLKHIASLADESTKIIPGHGPLANKSDVEKTIALLEDARELVAKLVKAGKSDAEILKANPLAKYQDYSWNFITTEKMTNQVIANLR